jgi:hypothetical protein
MSTTDRSTSRVKGFGDPFQVIVINMGVDVIIKKNGSNCGCGYSTRLAQKIAAPADRACHSAGIAAQSSTSGLGPRTLPWPMESWLDGLMEMDAARKKNSSKQSNALTEN